MANTSLDYYVLLEVSPLVTKSQIKASYHRLAKEHHPDKNRGSHAATLKTQQIIEAWDTLGDNRKRAKYDRSRYRGDQKFEQSEQTPANQHNAESTTSKESHMPEKPSMPTQPPRPKFPQAQRAQSDSANTFFTEDEYTPDPAPQAAQEEQHMRERWADYDRKLKRQMDKTSKYIGDCEKEITRLENEIKTLKVKVAAALGDWSICNDMMDIEDLTTDQINKLWAKIDLTQTLMEGKWDDRTNGECEYEDLRKDLQKNRRWEMARREGDADAVALSKTWKWLGGKEPRPSDQRLPPECFSKKPLQHYQLRTLNPRRPAKSQATWNKF